MHRWLDCFQLWYGCSLGISDDLIIFWNESIKNKMSVGRAVGNSALSKKLTDEIFSFFTDMTYVPGQFIPYVFFGTKP